MNRNSSILATSLLVASAIGTVGLATVGFGAAVAQDAPSTPAQSGTQEKVTVTLVEVDTLVIGKDGVSVPDLTKDDFDMKMGDWKLEVATLDVNCPIGAMADPLPIKGQNVPPMIGPGVKRRIVFAFDYYFLDITMRPQFLEAAKSMIEFAKTDEEEIMIAALAYGVRVEQRFTSDKKKLIQALTRMENDASLWPRQFAIGSTGEGYFEDYITLMDVLEGYDGSKAVVLFSQVRSVNSSMKTITYNEVAMHATVARSAIYPANPDLLLSSSGGSDTLVRFANQSGGRMPMFTSDVSLPYRQAQRDMSCRYTLGAYVDSADIGKKQSITVHVKNPDLKTRHPEMIKLYTDAEKQANRARAAFVDPQSYETPLIRAWAYPLFPASSSTWDTLVTLNLPLPVGPAGVDLDVSSTMQRGVTQVDKARRSVHVDPPADGAPTRSVTIFGDTKLKDGDHTFTAVLTQPGTAWVASAVATFSVPPVLDEMLILRGPIFAKAVPGGMLVKGDPKDESKDTRIDNLLGEDKAFEPLIVNQIHTSDGLIYYWNACVFGKLALKGNAVVHRTLMSDAGEVVHKLDEVPLKLEQQPINKQLQCHIDLAAVPPNTIPPGQYQVDIVVAYENGDMISHARAPLHVLPAGE